MAAKTAVAWDPAGEPADLTSELKALALRPGRPRFETGPPGKSYA